MADNETPAGDAPDTAAQDTDPAEDTTEPVEDDSTNGEAAKWRRRLRDAEAERDALAARLEAVQRQQVENLLDASGVKPKAVWAVAELADLLADDGTIDPEQVTNAVAVARDKFGIAKPAKGTVVPGVGNQPNGVPSTDKWKEAFTPARRR